MSLRLAKKLALSNDTHPKWMLASVISRKKAVLALGINKTKNNPEFVDQYLSVHAEIDALSRVRNPEGATIYVARVKRGGGFGLAKPCPRCQKALAEAGVKRAIYTIDNHTYGVWEPKGK